MIKASKACFSFFAIYKPRNYVILKSEKSLKRPFDARTLI